MASLIDHGGACCVSNVTTSGIDGICVFEIGLSEQDPPIIFSRFCSQELYTSCYRSNHEDIRYSNGMLLQLLNTIAIQYSYWCTSFCLSSIGIVIFISLPFGIVFVFSLPACAPGCLFFYPISLFRFPAVQQNTDGIGNRVFLGRVL